MYNFMVNYKLFIHVTYSFVKNIFHDYRYFSSSFQTHPRSWETSCDSRQKRHRPTNLKSPEGTHICKVARLHTSKVTLDISGRPIESQSRVTWIDMKLVDRLCHTETEGTTKKFWQGCAAQVFDRIPLAKDNLVESMPLAKDNFLIISPF